jgi:hypothetical protein
MDMFDYWRVTHVKEWFSRWYKPHNCKQEKIVTSHPKWDIHVWPWTLCHKNWMIPQYFSPIEWENMNRIMVHQWILEDMAILDPGSWSPMEILESKFEANLIISILMLVDVS